MPRVAHSETPQHEVTHNQNNCLTADLEEQLMRLHRRTRGCNHVWRTRQYNVGEKRGLARVCPRCKLVVAAFYAVEA